MIELQLPDDEPKTGIPPRPSRPAETTPVLLASAATLKPQNNFVPLAGAFLLGALSAFVVIRELGNESSDRDQSQDQKQVIDDGEKKDKDIPNAGLKDCKLIVIRDAKSTNEDSGWRATLQNDTFWRVTAPSIVKDVEFLEDDDAASKNAITVAGIAPPFVLLANSKTKKMVWVIPLPKNGVSEIERKLK